MNEIKIGDLVRFKRTICFDYITYEKDTIGEVTGLSLPYFVWVKAVNSENGKTATSFICTENVELVLPNNSEDNDKI